ncbi:MAG: fumarylacetoacetase [Bacteroidales bacterium]|nr:fumarylacetoacetase [Bacteroidales bacterium]MCF8403813.1 fumarylacetoacetase [Bacteroidales bacterium]
MMIKANNPDLESWIEVQNGNDFPIQNIPFGVVELKNGKTRCASRIGNYVIDLYAISSYGYFDNLGIDDLRVFKEPTLNNFIAQGQPAWRAIRERISYLFSKENPLIRDNIEEKSKILHHILDVKMMMPVAVGDYTDFYSSIEHATNVGKMFRDPENALLPNWKHIPVGYHGRSSSIVVSGTSIHRPKGQTKADDELSPAFGPSKLFDFELEMAFIAGKQSKLGDSISVSDAENHIFGLVLFNDLSARDIQKWEYVPLGPFLSKNFGSVISPWIVTLDALEPFRVNGPIQDPKVLPYLEFEGKKNFDINLEVFIQPENGEKNSVCRSNFKYMYWNMAQQLAHHTINGCNINVGDMYGSGTISGPTPDSFGSMMELSWKGTRPVKLKDGTERKFIQDNDTIIMTGFCRNNNLRIGFGETITKILPAK